MTPELLLTENRRRRELLISQSARLDTSRVAHLTPEELKERMRDDFELWAALCVKIYDKRTRQEVPLLLNRPQRRVAAMLDEDRRAGRPLRLILLKARQWGGSTLIQAYMAWIQCVHRLNWNSLVCAHTKDTASTLRGMLTMLLSHYPPELWDGDGDPGLRPYERSVNTRVVGGRGCRITIGSAESQENVRGLDISMAHLSEVAFWRDTTTRSGADFARAVCSGIALEPYTLIALESTANGVGGYFHAEWVRAVRGESDKRAVFVPWHEIDLYQRPVADHWGLWQKLDAYERELWTVHGLTLEQIAWYRAKRREYPDHRGMKAEYPTTAVEAFATTATAVFDAEAVQRLRQGCCAPVAVGEVSMGDAAGFDTFRARQQRCIGPVRYSADSQGGLQIWQMPESRKPDAVGGVVPPMPGGRRYIVAVDIGGRSASSDWSVIAVLATYPTSGADPEVVAQWRGHVDHDHLAWKAIAIARFYNNALLVIESNTLETEADGDSLSVLEQVAQTYGNLYYRVDRTTAGGQVSQRPGFHTNRTTKGLVINTLRAALRDGTYTERDSRACDELEAYRHTPQGGYEAAEGHHDDILMTRAIALYVASQL